MVLDGLNNPLSRKLEVSTNNSTRPQYSYQGSNLRVDPQTKSSDTFSGALLAPETQKNGLERLIFVAGGAE